MRDVLQRDHLPGLDRLRVGLALSVLLFHAAVPYTACPLPGLTWPTRHADPSGLLAVPFWSLAVLVMPVFFWLSGYGVAQSLERQGSWEFLKSRWRRIGRPGLAFAAVLLPIELFLWVSGWVREGLLPAVKLRSYKVGIYDAGLWGPSNLWYLQYLLLYCGLLAAWRYSEQPQRLRIWSEDRSSSNLARWSARLAQVERFLGRCWDGVGGSLLLIVPGMGLLTLHPAILLGFEHSWWPQPWKVLFLGLFFCAGVASHRQDNRPHARTQTATPFLTLCGGVLLLVAAAPWLSQYLSHPSGVLIHSRMTANPDPTLLAWPFRLVLAGLISGGVVLNTLGLSALARADRRPESSMIKSGARASYWIYLVHHPLVAACHVGLCRTGWGALPQFLLTALITLGTCWGSYRLFVHQTNLGAFLDGQNRRRCDAPEASSENRKAA